MLWIILAIAIPVVLTSYWMWDFGEFFIPLLLGVLVFIASIENYRIDLEE